jgi:dTDP-4-dehydrorhamnose reductase
MIKAKKIPKLLITGSSGLIGSYLIKKITNYKVLKPSHKALDISNSFMVKQYFIHNKPDLIIHCAGHRNATSAENQRGDKTGSVWKTNVLGTKNIVEQVINTNSYLIHISTDYVFSGSTVNPGPYSEKDVTENNDNYLSWYGITKREAESLVLQSPHASIIRINNIANPNRQDIEDYVGKILWLYKKNQLYPLFNDQQITLTYLPLLVEIIHTLLKKKLPGIYHASTSNTCTPHELATYLVKKMANENKKLDQISINEYLLKNPHRYPKWGGLDSKVTQIKLGLEVLSWREVINQYFE